MEIWTIQTNAGQRFPHQASCNISKKIHRLFKSTTLCSSSLTKDWCTRKLWR